MATNCIATDSNTNYNDVIMGAIASQITSLTIVYSAVYSDADQNKHQSSASLAFVRGIHRGPVNSPHKWPVTRKMFPLDDVIMSVLTCVNTIHLWPDSMVHQWEHALATQSQYMMGNATRYQYLDRSYSSSRHMSLIGSKMLCDTCVVMPHNTLKWKKIPTTGWDAMGKI